MKFFKTNAGDVQAQSGAAQAPLEALRAKLRELQAAPAREVGGDGTVSNDGPLPADKKTQVERDEALVRPVLALFGLDYAALITAEEGPNGEKSPYAQAVAANPRLLQEVLAADNPVLAALQVAVSFKPYADFTQKYGTTPEAIKAAIVQEAQGQAKPAGERDSRRYGPVFSGTYGTAAATAPGPKKTDLKSVFGK